MQLGPQRFAPRVAAPSGALASIVLMTRSYSFDGAEAWLRATAPDELPALAIARSATDALAVALDGAAVPAAKDPAPPVYYARSALLWVSSPFGGESAA
jgi:hypothetical protein